MRNIYFFTIGGNRCLVLANKFLFTEIFDMIEFICVVHESLLSIVMPKNLVCSTIGSIYYSTLVHF